VTVALSCTTFESVQHRDIPVVTMDYLFNKVIWNNLE